MCADSSPRYDWRPAVAILVRYWPGVNWQSTIVWTSMVPELMVAYMKPTPKPAKARFDSLEQEVYLNLWRTYDRLRALEDYFFSGYELTAQQYNVLRLL